MSESRSIELSACAVVLALSGALGCDATLGMPVGGSGAAENGSGGAGSSAGGSSSGGAGGGSGGTEVVTLPGGLELEGQPEYYRVVRLTHSQWENSVRDVLALPELTELSSGFISDPPNGKFSNNERSLYVSDTLWGDYQRSAEQVAELVTSDQEAMDRLNAPADSADFIATIGERAFRRALTADEQADYVALWARGSEFFEGSDAFTAGARLFLEALLQSPQFLYRTELAEPGARLSGLELATKVSHLLRDTVPDEALIQAANAGQLDTNEGLVTVVSALLDEDFSRASAERFHRELFGLDRYQSILKNETAFPTYDVALNQVLLDADLLFFSRVYTGGFGLREVLLSSVGYVNDQTAGFYGLTSTSSTLSEVTLGPDRPGFLTRLGFLAYNATLNDPDPIHRGVDINNKLLCAHLEPPAGEIPPLPDSVPGQTNRQRVEAHTGEGFCGNCHNTVINPPGFALENFDAMGQWRTTDNGQLVDASGTFAVLEQELSFDGIADLTTQLAESPVAHACYTANLAEFALSRDIGAGELSLLTEAQALSQGSDASVKALLLTMIQSPQFTNTRAVSP